MMICWIFVFITLGAAAVATFVNDLHRAVLSLWVAGLGVGAVYLTLGAELLAIVQWIISTLVVISFVFYSVMFGEFGRTSNESQPARNKVKMFLGLLAGLAFAGLIGLGVGQFPKELLGQSAEGTDLASVGKVMMDEHFLSLEVLALMLFLVLIGGGVVARPSEEESK